MSAKYNIAVVGATGAVGEELFRVMEDLDFPIGELLPLASAKRKYGYLPSRLLLSCCHCEM